LVERRQRRVLLEAQRTNALVGSLFPEAVRDRLLKQSEDKYNRKGGMFKKRTGEVEAAPKLRLKTFMADDNRATLANMAGVSDTEPIADLFPKATVLFADIAGFTAWSSEREPSQVFALLETLYGGIDNIARKLGVFKVETVGDW
jgi:class 3 adenylate cyclase